MAGRSQAPRTASIERKYARALMKVARHVGDIINGFPAAAAESISPIQRALGDYAELITGWATHQATEMLQAVDRLDETAWRKRSVEMAGWMRREIRDTPTGELMRMRLEEQVHLIKSLPIEAGQRVHKLTIEALENGERASTIEEEIRRSGDVTKSRAQLIARTEVARTSAELVEARATRIGSDGYIWRTSEDGDVRDSHKEMNGKYVPWSTPPTLSDGTTTHAGMIYNCRCYPDPVIPE